MAASGMGTRPAKIIGHQKPNEVSGSRKIMQTGDEIN
jgi:hypothetical protein